MTLGYLHKPNFHQPESWRVKYKTANGVADLKIVRPEDIDVKLKEAKDPILVEFMHLPANQTAMVQGPTTETVDWEFDEFAIAQPVAAVNAQPAVLDPADKVFHNPYNFIPAPPPKLDGDLGQTYPAGHHAYSKNLNTGWVDVTLETVTPLLLTDAANMSESSNGHKTYDTRCETRDGDKYPLFPVTSFKGGLRNAYEAITNSRFGVFRGHDEELATRQSASAGAPRIPARVGTNSEGNLILELFLSRTENGKLKANNAWLPTYGARGSAQKVNPNWENPQGEEYSIHGEEVTCKIQKVQHPKIAFDEVVKLNFKERTYGLGSAYSSQRYTPVENTDADVWGYICANNKNFGKKHDERVFWMPKGKEPKTIELTPEHKKLWKQLIKNYKEEHERSGANSPNTVISRHILETNSETLCEGDLLYVDIPKSLTGNTPITSEHITGLFPVLVSRELQQASPDSLLPDELKPNQKMATSSPADRVFGWTNPEGDGGYKGQLLIDPLVCQSKAEDALEKFKNGGLPLAILGEPKPKQARFYVADSQNGEAMADGLDGKDGRENSLMAYKQGKGLRGRKVYPHHATSNVDNYWDAIQAMQDANTANWRSDKTPMREYVKVPSAANNPERGTQNRSINSWVKPEIKFTTRIRYTNLNNAELGALLYILKGEDAYLRMGGAKPLGFGSMRSAITGFRVETGDDIAKRLKSNPFAKVAAADEDSLNTWIGDYLVEFAAALHEYGIFAEISFIAAWKAGKSQTLPHAYPREKAAPQAKGENFKWFAENNKEKWPKNQPKKQRSFTLPDLASGKGLPRFD